jgi:proline dehydrogenase
MEKERAHAIAKGLASPVYETKGLTDENFNSAIRYCMENLLFCDFCLATHNAESTRLLLDLMHKYDVQPGDRKIFFSQLYGMSDYLTFNLAAAGYNASKYLPYGSIPTAMPYLSRRAEENSSIAGQLSRERIYIEKEINRRKRAQEAQN